MQMKLYVNTRGRVLGPIDVDRILSLVQNGRISADATVSDDRVTWISISELQSLLGKKTKDEVPRLKVEPPKQEKTVVTPPPSQSEFNQVPPPPMGGQQGYNPGVPYSAPPQGGPQGYNQGAPYSVRPQGGQQAYNQGVPYSAPSMGEPQGYNQTVLYEAPTTGGQQDGEQLGETYLRQAKGTPQANEQGELYTNATLIPQQQMNSMGNGSPNNASSSVNRQSRSPFFFLTIGCFSFLTISCIIVVLIGIIYWKASSTSSSETNASSTSSSETNASSTSSSEITVNVTVKKWLASFGEYWTYNCEYKLYADDVCIATKNSTSMSVSFKVKVKKGAELRAEMLPKNGFGGISATHEGPRYGQNATASYTGQYITIECL